MATMEDLTKTQMVLLTLLVSFITSIATGIITTSLLAEAPASVTQTINRVVEHTIERVVPTATSTGQTIKEVTIVKEEDAILSSIDKTTKGVVRLAVRGSDGNDVFYALGAIVSKDGVLVTDGQGMVLDGSYTATLADGTNISAAVVSRSVDQNIAVLKLMSTNPKQVYTPIPLSGNALRPGQTVVAFEGKSDTGVAVGRVVNLITKTEGTSKTVKAVMTDLSSRGETGGGPLVNLSGELVGIKSSSVDLTLPPGVYTSLGPIKDQIAVPAAAR